ncbi:hypothetical protein GCM10007315_21560 [Gemmobacter tilapiae]|uniref:Uncharacterized protein n=2 Tax=Neogemmobacter tilapiae TaxID=875041 RepID=A0A918TPG7_9RHOB|nr:hypothetical protein GCM10007315_21560 [Gemmobacter tilapiae]
MTALGLLENGQWTKHAEAILWRENPSEWNLDVVGHPMFKRAVETAIETMPPDIQAELDKLTRIDEVALDAAMERERNAHENPPQRTNGLTLFRTKTLSLTREKVAFGIQFDRKIQLDELFFRHWRLADGWLSPTDAKRALNIFHDPLAKAMRRAVMGRIFPETPFAH